jgi:hypothetical protein
MQAGMHFGDVPPGCERSFTNQMLYQLSYASLSNALSVLDPHSAERLERETRIELATNSLEGCDSTIELLPLEWTALAATDTIVRNATELVNFPAPPRLRPCRPAPRCYP